MTENPLGYEKISKLLKNFAVPSIVASLIGSIYNIVDQIFIGQGVGYLGNAATNVARSEERRVGKERRSRWSPYH